MKVQIFSDLHLDVARIKPITTTKTSAWSSSPAIPAKVCSRRSSILRRIVPLSHPDCHGDG